MKDYFNLFLLTLNNYFKHRKLTLFYFLFYYRKLGNIIKLSLLYKATHGGHQKIKKKGIKEEKKKITNCFIWMEKGGSKTFKLNISFLRKKI